VDTIKRNVDRNLPKDRREIVTVVGHAWGEFGDEIAMTKKQAFSRIMAADTLWIEGAHEALLASFAHFLSEDEGATVWVIAGMHTGRAVVAAFWDTVEKSGKWLVESLWEMDVEGNEREWMTERREEGVGERKRWVIVGILKRRETK
jgi:hypothetical protein